MKSYFLLVPVILFLSSCNKEISTDDDSTLPEKNATFIQFAVTSATFTPSNKFLKKEVTYLTSNPTMKYVREFSYDAANRCTNIKIGTIDSSASNPQFTQTQIITFNYNGTSILPAYLSNVRSVFPNLVTNFYFKYNSQGFKIQDSVRVKNQAGDPADRVINYTYVNGKVYAIPVFTGFSLNNNSYDTLYLANGNLEKRTSKYIRATGDQTIEYSFTYDKNISPYNKLNIANSLYFESASIGLGYNVPIETHYMGVTNNNMTSLTNGPYTVTFSYMYDDDNYPVKREVIDPSNPNTIRVTRFEY